MRRSLVTTIGGLLLVILVVGATFLYGNSQRQEQQRQDEQRQEQAQQKPADQPAKTAEANQPASQPAATTSTPAPSSTSTTATQPTTGGTAQPQPASMPAAGSGLGAVIGVMAVGGSLYAYRRSQLDLRRRLVA
jgi:cytoskeletal protein RodZ